MATLAALSGNTMGLNLSNFGGLNPSLPNIGEEAQ